MASFQHRTKTLLFAFAGLWMLSATLSPLASTERLLSRSQMQTGARGGSQDCWYPFNSRCVLTGTDDCSNQKGPFACGPQTPPNPDPFCTSCTTDTNYDQCLNGGATYEMCTNNPNPQGCGNVTQTGCLWTGSNCTCDTGNYENMGTWCSRITISNTAPCT
jgi:hypothetical protein